MRKTTKINKLEAYSLLAEAVNRGDKITADKISYVVDAALTRQHENGTYRSENFDLNAKESRLIGKVKPKIKIKKKVS